MNIANERFLSAKQIQGEFLKAPGRDAYKDTTEGQGSFGDILGRMQNEVSQGNEIRFSKHAEARLATRDITLDDTQMDRLQDGVAKASMKGIKESLLIMDKLAFIVNVPSATVVTALDSTTGNEQVFTNIDGAVIV